MTSIYIKPKPLTFGWLFLKLPHFYTSTRYLKKKKLKTLPSPFLPKTKPESHSLSLSFVSQRKTWEKNIVGLQLLLKIIYIYNIDLSTYNRHKDCAKKKMLRTHDKKNFLHTSLGLSQICFRWVGINYNDSGRQQKTGLGADQLMHTVLPSPIVMGLTFSFFDGWWLLFCFLF